MEIGDTVKIIDGSYSYEMTSEGLKITGRIIDDTYELIYKDLKLPADNSYNKEYYNNCIVKEIRSGRIFFTNQRFLKTIVKPQPIIVNITTKIDLNDLNEIKIIIGELEERLKNLKIKISL